MWWALFHPFRYRRGVREFMAALSALDLADTPCPDCGHPRTCAVCSCTGPGTCGGGTDDVEGGA